MTHKIEKISHYNFHISTCEKCEIAEHGKIKYLDVLLNHGSGLKQFIPPINLVDIHTAEKYLCETFGLNSIGELKGKEIWSIANPTEIFALINPSDKKMFSLQSFYLSNNFKDDIENYKKLDEYKHVNLDNIGMFNFIVLNESVKKNKSRRPNT